MTKQAQDEAMMEGIMEDMFKEKLEELLISCVDSGTVPEEIGVWMNERVRDLDELESMLIAYTDCDDIDMDVASNIMETMRSEFEVKCDLDPIDALKKEANDILAQDYIEGRDLRRLGYIEKEIDTLLAKYDY